MDLVWLLGDWKWPEGTDLDESYEQIPVIRVAPPRRPTIEETLLPGWQVEKQPETLSRGAMLRSFIMEDYDANKAEFALRFVGNNRTGILKAANRNFRACELEMSLGFC